MVLIIVCIIAGLGAGIGTGLAGLSAAVVITPMLITFCGFSAYEAVGIALASDVLASAVTAYTYGKNKNLDIKNGLVMMASVLVFTILGSWLSSLLPNAVLGYSLKTAVGTSTFIMTFTALTGAVSHVIIGGTVNIPALVICVVAALVGARASALFANKVDAKKQNRVTGIALCGLGAVLASLKQVISERNILMSWMRSKRQRVKTQ